MKKLFTHISIPAIFILLGVVSCSNDNNFKKYSFHDDQLTISVPEDWKLLNDGDESSTSIHNEKSLGLSFNLFSSEGDNFDELCRIKIDEIIEKFEDSFYIENDASFKFNTSYKLKYTVLKHKENFVLLSLFVIKNEDKYLSITFTSVPGNLEDDKPIIEQIINRIKITTTN